MLCGGSIARSVSKEFPPEVNLFVQALRNYDESLEGLRGLAKAAKSVGLPDVVRAAIDLQRLDGSKEFNRKGIGRFGQAPKKIYPKRAEVFGHFLTTLNKSPNYKVRQFATEMGLAWFKNEAVPHGVRGRDFYG